MDLDTTLAEAAPARHGPLPGPDSPGAASLYRRIIAQPPPAAPAWRRHSFGIPALTAAAAVGPATIPRPRQLWRGSWSARAGALAAAVTAAVTVIAVTSGGATTPRASLAADVLTTAARTVAAEPTAEPAPDQWLYTDCVGGGSSACHEFWLRFDGTEGALPGSGSHSVTVFPLTTAHASRTEPGNSALAAFHNNQTPLTAYNALASLPTSPPGLLAAVDGQLPWAQLPLSAETTSQKEFDYLGILLTQALIAPPTALASVYHAIAMLPGITISHVTDAAGRPAIGVSDGGEMEMQLDPRTYLVTGWDVVSAKWSPTTHEMTVVSRTWFARVKIAEVSGPGRR
jgi:hypothetical protein